MTKELESAIRKMELMFALAKLEEDNWAWNTIKQELLKER